MSQLQLGLLAIGVIIVVFVLAYNKFQELRYRRNVERALGDRQDVLMGEDKVAAQTAISNISESDPETRGPSGALQGVKGEGREHLDLQANERRIDPEPIAAASNAAGISPALDYVLTISSDLPIDCSLASRAITPILGNFSKLVIAEAGVAPEPE